MVPIGQVVRFNNERTTRIRFSMHRDGCPSGKHLHVACVHLYVACIHLYVACLLLYVHLHVACMIMFVACIILYVACFFVPTCCNA